jgi:CheY-like chemotaxis protein
MKTAKQEYITAANGLEALQRFQAGPLSFRVIFMGMHHRYALLPRHNANTEADLSMPVMDGLTSTRHIRVHERENSLPRTRIVALTCFSSPEYQRDAALSGVDTFLIKPVPMKTLKPILDLDPEYFPEV